MVRLIDADALAKFIDYGHLNNPNEKLYSENDIREMIDMMPTQPVDAVPVRHGRWIKENIVLTSYPQQYQWHCSQCGQAVHGFTADVLTDYCPHCGAKMERKEE